jgi:teichuronic acid biosynthesis glycosyltransferase TuaG
MNKLVSIITPSYNSAKYIAETIQSVQNQTYTNWEMIIVDDCSTDDTEKIIKEIQQIDFRIFFYKLDRNSGSGVARNFAVEKANGNYIAFLDSDDLWKPNKLLRQLTFMKNNNLPITFSFYEKINEKGSLLNKTVCSPKAISYRMLFYCNWIGNLTGIYSVDFFGKISITSFRKRQDWALWLTLIKQVKNVIPVPESLAYYRVRKDSISASKIKLIENNYLIYRNFHNNNWLFANLNTLLFLINQLFFKPIFTKNRKL